MSTPLNSTPPWPTPRNVSLAAAIVLPALAAGMGWGIRGQYGHETGAMIAGALASLTLVLLFAPHLSSLTGARAAALMTAGIGIGGSMTYGQTIGLTQNAPVVGNWEALRWGMLGLAIKGGIWIGFGGIFLGMGLGGKRYRFWEMGLVMLGVFGLYQVGISVLNSPYDPVNRVLPAIYFSESWYFTPEGVLKPRREVWGGMLFALVGLLAYARIVRGDRLALRLGLAAIIGGALGFPGGQCIQAFHAWNRDAFAASSWSDIYRIVNWWNMMETTFGLVWGGTLGLGVWWNRRLIATDTLPESVSLKPSWEVGLCCVHVILLLASEFARFSPDDRIVRRYTEFGLVMTVLPVMGILGGRFWPYLLILPIVAAPIAGKTLRGFTYEIPRYSGDIGWLVVILLPMTLLFIAATSFIERSQRGQTTRGFASLSLLLSIWIYFGLNTMFFEGAWPWFEWTSRTPNQLIYMACASILTGWVLLGKFRRA